MDRTSGFGPEDRGSIPRRPIVNIFKLNNLYFTMLMKTHLVFGIFWVLLLINEINNKFIFSALVILISLLPDLDTKESHIGRRLIFKPIQWVVKHRTFFHSLTFCLAISILLSFYLPILALPFFIGYTGHLFLDSLTPEGIRMFWPLKTTLSGPIRTGGKVESGIYYTLTGVNIILMIFIIIKVAS